MNVCKVAASVLNGGNIKDLINIRIDLKLNWLRPPGTLGFGSASDAENWHLAPGVRSPANDGPCPREPRAEAGQNHDIALLDNASAVGLGQRDGDTPG